MGLTGCLTDEDSISFFVRNRAENRPLTANN
jgi:hypothetical protein